MKKLLILLLVVVVGCQPQTNIQKVEKKQPVYYEIFVASFNDSNQDGIGDLKGITQKIDYLDDLGVTGLWLMPIHPSDSYHKYDVKDYLAIDPSYGTMADFEELVTEAKKRNIKIMLDLVLNHSSSDHPWFLDAKNRTTCTKCDYYHFSDTAKTGYAKLNDQLFYEARFWEKMPDLNLKNEKVKQEIKNIAQFWIDKGVGGFRLDAVGHFFDESLQETIAFTKWFVDTTKAMNPDIYIVGEAWVGENGVLSHYESQIDSLFDFAGSELNGRIVKYGNDEAGQQLAIDTIEYNQKIKAISPNSKNATFLSNHDQARSAGYLIDDDTRKLMAALYLLSPGVPFIYYGEEIAMKGSGKDENKRLALTWGENKDAKSPKDSDYESKHPQTIKEALKDPNSLLNYYKQVIRFRHLYVNHSNSEVVKVNPHVFGLKYDQYQIFINIKEEQVTFDIEGELIDKIGDVKKQNKQLILPKYAIAVIR